ncbi:hypothetical protein [Rhodoplanes sp. SY1]|uniref:hypothetical protein n=1 Tax=Rhodoplanes sp. SY1 TaxID=3166646 RepID=UPI0038B5C644
MGYADKESAQIVAGIVGLLEGTTDCVSYFYPCHSDENERWFARLGFAVAQQSVSVVLVHLDISRMIGRADNAASSFEAQIFGPPQLSAVKQCQATSGTDPFAT